MLPQADAKLDFRLFLPIIDTVKGLASKAATHGKSTGAFTRNGESDESQTNCMLLGDSDIRLPRRLYYLGVCPADRTSR